MNYTKILSIGLVCMGTSIGFSSFSHAENNIASKSANQQKQWVGKPAPSFKLQDQNAKWHQKFSEKLALPFPILADSNQQLAQQYGIVRNFGIAQIAKRESFLIDPQGTIVYHYNSVNTQSHAAQVLADIEKLTKSK